jgi:fatty-acyl-CoA synthase
MAARPIWQRLRWSHTRQHQSRRDLHAERLPALRTVIQLGSENIPGMFSLEQIVGWPNEASLHRLEAIAQQLDFDAAVNIQFTSGTTGAPKAATLTHHNMINNARMSADILGFTEKDRLCIPVPMYHCFGMVLGTLLCATTGAAILLQCWMIQTSDNTI